jgi:hypothetical protein
MQSMIKQMCKNELNDSDIKAICKSRSFPADGSTSRDIFENFFISTIGIKEALDSLTYEEIVFLHLLNKINKEVDIEYFDRLYDNARPAGGYDSRTFNQKYKETFNKVKNNLIRKGVMIFQEREVYYTSTKMERMRFCFPPEFAPFLPPMVKASKFNKTGNFKSEILRNKLLEIIGEKQKKSPLSNERSSTLAIKDGDLTIGDEKFRVSHLLKWQQACWHESAEEKTSRLSNDMTPIEVTLYALSQLQEQEWLPAEALTVILKIFTGKESKHPENICELGWEWGCLAKVVADGKTYYRLPDDFLEDTASSSPENYLKIKPDGTVALDLVTIPYSALEVLAFVSILEVCNSNLQAVPSLIKIGNSLKTVRKNTVFEWLKENSSVFRTAIEKAQKRWGKQIIHENIMIARVKDLSLKVQIGKSFADPKSLVSLPNDYMAFPCDQLPAIQKLVEKSGHVIKKMGAKQ